MQKDWEWALGSPLSNITAPAHSTVQFHAHMTSSQPGPAPVSLPHTPVFPPQHPPLLLKAHPCQAFKCSFMPGSLNS